MMGDTTGVIAPNRKYRAGHLEISCYGRGMIMVNHVQLDAPIPIGPQDEDEFWEKPEDERLRTVIEYVEAKIDWMESSPDIWLGLGDDLLTARESIESEDSDEDSS